MLRFCYDDLDALSFPHGGGSVPYRGQSRIERGTFAYQGCAYRKSKPDILVVQPAENWAAKNLPGPFDGTRERRILLQGEMCAGAIIIFHVRQQQVAEVAFAEHDNVVEAISSDRTDQPFGIPVLPWRPWRRRLIANAH